ncbi:hypothetical protein HW11_23080 [Pseudomonas aeruginosa]|nr:hypothetical protein HW11_23080 [Pseudomonas aeruginosa]
MRASPAFNPKNTLRIDEAGALNTFCVLVSNQIISDHGDRDSSRGEQGEQSLDQARLATAYRPSET